MNVTPQILKSIFDALPECLEARELLALMGATFNQYMGGETPEVQDALLDLLKSSIIDLRSQQGAISNV